MIPDAISAAGGAQPMTLAEAAQVANADATYARIEDGNWDCTTLTPVLGLSPSHRTYGSRLREDTKSTEVFFSDDARSIAMFVTLSGEVECNDLTGVQPSGYLYEMSGSTRQELKDDARLGRYSEATSYLEFCGYCGQENSLIGAIFGVVFTGLGLGLLFFGLNMRNKNKIEG
jgi:hypothetical protein